MTRLDPQLVAREIYALIEAYPELAEDDVLRADTIEGETDAGRVVAMLLERLRHADAMHAALWPA